MVLDLWTFLILKKSCQDPLKVRNNMMMLEFTCVVIYFHVWELQSWEEAGLKGQMIQQKNLFKASKFSRLIALWRKNEFVTISLVSNFNYASKWKYVAAPNRVITFFPFGLRFHAEYCCCCNLDYVAWKKPSHFWYRVLDIYSWQSSSRRSLSSTWNSEKKPSL